MSIHQKAKMVINMPVCLSEFQKAPDDHSSVSKSAPSDSHKLTDQENENDVMQRMHVGRHIQSFTHSTAMIRSLKILSKMVLIGICCVGSTDIASIAIFSHATPIRCLIAGLLDCNPMMSQRICIDDFSCTVKLYCENNLRFSLWSL